jgi:hypothetical protein
MSGNNTAPATAARLRKQALRAIDDPATLARAARIVRAGLERGLLTRDDLAGPIVPPADPRAAASPLEPHE